MRRGYIDTEQTEGFFTEHREKGGGHDYFCTAVAGALEKGMQGANTFIQLWSVVRIGYNSSAGCCPKPPRVMVRTKNCTKKSTFFGRGTYTQLKT